MTVGERIKNKRIRLELTQELLAQKMGVTFQAISKWENDKSLPDVELLPKLSSVLDESIDFLLTGKEFERRVVPQKDDAFTYFNSLITPLVLREEEITNLRKAINGRSNGNVKDAINIAFNQYGPKGGVITYDQVKLMVQKIPGILYNQSLDPVSQKIGQMVSFLQYTTGNNDRDIAGRLKRSIRKLLEAEEELLGEKTDPIALLDKINEMHLVGATSPWAARSSVEKQITEVECLIMRKKENRRRDLERLEIQRRIDEGYFHLENRCSEEIKDSVDSLNTAIKSGKQGVAERVYAVVSQLSMEMLSYADNQDDFLKRALEEKDFRTVAPKMYDYLGSYLGKEAQGNLLKMISVLDEAMKDENEMSLKILDDFQEILSSLLKKCLVLKNRFDRKNP